MNVRLLLSTQRSGSHFLKSFIESRFQSVICSGEVLEEPIAFSRQAPALSSHPEFPKFWLWYELEVAARSISVAPDRRIEAFEAYLAKASALVQPKDLLIDIKYNSIRSLSGYLDTECGSFDFTSFVIKRQMPVLHLIRKNTLRIIISNKLAQQTGIWHRTKERSAEEHLPKMRLHPKVVLNDIRYLQKVTKDYQNCFSGHPSYEEIVYEDLVLEQVNPQSGANLRTLAHFFDKKPSLPSTAEIPFKKTTPEDPSEVVENWDEVCRVLRGTEHGWMVETPLLAAA